MKNDKRIGLSLSGGGYRAAAFHLGTLIKLNELGILKYIDVLSTISGGSIAGAYYLMKKDDFQTFEAGLKQCLGKSVIRRILFSPFMLGLYAALLALLLVVFYNTWRQYNIVAGLLAIFLLVIILLVFQFTFLPLTALKIRAYRRIFFGKKTLKDLPGTPLIAINATNLETGTLWTYSQNKVSDSSYAFPKDKGPAITFNAADFPLAIAVASSTCVPVPFTPVKIDKRYFSNPADYKRVSPSLSDGGLYDNQGIHKLTERKSSYRCDVIICSDGSEPFRFSFAGNNSFQVLYRANDIMMRKIKSLQFIRDVYSRQFEIAYFSLDWHYEICISGFIKAIEEDKVTEEVLAYYALTPALLSDIKTNQQTLQEEVKQKIGFATITAAGLTVDEIKEISRIKTGLSAFTEQRIELIARHAATLTELQVKLYCPTLINDHHGI